MTSIAKKTLLISIIAVGIIIAGALIVIATANTKTKDLQADLDAKTAYAEELALVIEGKVAEIKDKDEIIADKDKVIADKDTVIAEKDAEIESLK
jgi:hypothetical protein